ncbi:MAG TPA: AarF/UbiB family protein [Fimbriimonadaceae bacterium]|nr:AarF/UbiB family protein [Fimbriimonadaceae bacterium]
MANNDKAERRARALEIAGILIRNGFGFLVNKWGLAGPQSRWRMPQRYPRPHEKQTQPERVRRTLEELGATFIKLGQVLSTRSDLLPAEYIAELAKLQDDVPPVPYEDIVGMFQQELGGPPEQFFLGFNPVPRAAASIGQVHDALLLDGTRVVVKVRRPGIEKTVDEDLAIMKDLAEFLESNTSWAKDYDLVGQVEEFAFTLLNELDYTREGRNADRIRRNFSEDPTLYVPEVFWELTTSGVLVMEEIEGIKVGDHAALDAAGIDRHQLARRCAHVALVQVLDHGFYHADPHPGNFFVLEEPEGVIALIDFGMVGRADEKLRRTMNRLALAVTQKDVDRMIDELTSLGAMRGKIERQGLRRDLSHLLLKYDNLPLGKMSAGGMFNDLTQVSQRHGLQLPAQLTLLAKVITMAEGLGRDLDPDFDFFGFAKPYFKSFYRRAYSQRALKRRLRDGSIDLLELGLDLPQRLRHTMDQLDRGELTVTSRVELEDEVIGRLERATNRLAISVLVAGLVVGLSYLTSAFRPEGTRQFGFMFLEFLMVSGLIGGIYLVVSFWRSRK